MAEPLRSFGPDGEPQAYSYDGGKNWSPVNQRGKKAPEEMIKYERKIAAIMPHDGTNPHFERRIVAPFEPLRDASILAGWANLETILAMPEGSLDALVIPDPNEDTLELLPELRKVAGKILVDIDPVNQPDMKSLYPVVSEADAVLVPADSMTTLLRKHNSRAFTVPPVISPSVWKGVKREQNEVIRMALQPTSDRHVADSVKYIGEKWGAKLEIVEDDWYNRSIYDEPAFYTKIDIVVAGSHGRFSTNASIIAPMMAGCAIITDSGHNRTILHGHSGLLVVNGGPSGWRRELDRLVSDSRLRTKMQKGGRERGQYYIGRKKLNALALPYRVVLA